MLIKAGDYRINLAHVAFIEGGRDMLIIELTSGGRIQLKDDRAIEFLTTWDKWAAFQAEVQEINEFSIRENIAHIRAAQNKSGIVIPKMTTPRGRG